MNRHLSAFLVSDSAGPVLTVAVIAIGLLCLLIGRRRMASGGGRILNGSGVAILIVGGVFALGALCQAISTSSFLKAHPPPGKLVDVGGFRVHVWCEGQSPPGAPTIVWLPGGYFQGLHSYPFHRALREEFRSCLYDRPGTGYSENGPVPRTPEREVRILAAALEGAAEHGPFLMVGHSMGGLLSATYAVLFPERVRGVVALEATAPMVLAVGHRTWCHNAPATFLQVLGAHFNLPQIVPSFYPGTSEPSPPGLEATAEVRDAFRRFENCPMQLDGLVAGKIPCGDAEEALDEPTTPGVLGSLPLLVVVKPEDTAAQRAAFAKWAQGYGANQFELDNIGRIMEASRHQYESFSGASRLLTSPPGTDHDFPDEAPAWTIETVRRFARELTVAPEPPIAQGPR